MMFSEEDVKTYANSAPDITVSHMLREMARSHTAFISQPNSEWPSYVLQLAEQIDEEFPGAVDWADFRLLNKAYGDSAISPEAKTRYMRCLICCANRIEERIGDSDAT